MIVHWLLSHWMAIAGVGLLGLACAFPAISLPILRWLIGTERGRYVLIACAAVGGFLFLRNHFIDVGYSRAMAKQARAADRSQVHAATQAIARDTTSSAATDVARQSAADRSVEQNTRAARVEGIAHEVRQPVPVVCPGPDPRLVRESQDATARIHAAEDRLRSSGRAASAKPK